MSDMTGAAGFATLAIHAGAQPDLALASPRDLAVDLPFRPQLDPTLGSGDGTPHLGRSCAACAMLEERVATLEGGTAALATASGQTARLLAFLTLLQPGDELVAARRPAAAPPDALGETLRRFGRHVRWAEADKPESLVEALSDRTKAILVGSITETGGVIDIEAAATIARRARVPLVVDNTLATPYLVHPLEHGADIVLYTATALLAGHASARGGLLVDGGTFGFAGDDRFPALSQPAPSLGGLVVAETYGNFAFAMGARAGLGDLGGALAPLEAMLATAGIETMALRLRRHCDNALAVARHLERHPKVAWVGYAGLEGDTDHALALRYCPSGAGGILAFGLADGSAEAVTRRLRLFAPAVEAGGSPSLVLRQPAPDTLRLSIGLEDAADIVADLDQALERT